MGAECDGKQALLEMRLGFHKIENMKKFSTTTRKKRQTALAKKTFATARESFGLLAADERLSRFMSGATEIRTPRIVRQERAGNSDGREPDEPRDGEMEMLKSGGEERRRAGVVKRGNPARLISRPNHMPDDNLDSTPPSSPSQHPRPVPDDPFARQVLPCTVGHA